MEYRKVRHYEPAIMRRFDSCLLISQHDKQAIAGHAELDNVFYSPHGVDVAYYTPRHDKPRERAVLFCGVMETPTNIDAALWFHSAVFPLVKAKCPDVRLYIAGRSPVRAIRRLAERDPAVVVTGFVKDLREYYERIRVGVDPLRIGAGLQNKLLIGMSMKQPMVCTSIANEGISAEDGRHLVIADEPRAFADAVVDLLLNDEKAASIAREARRFVETQWTWEYHLEQLEAHLVGLVR
jgi:glycosyltransferase involved in cell wall biosynthesis